MNRIQVRIAVPVLSFALSFTLVGLLSAKSETVRMTITGTDFPRPVEITDISILTRFNIWSGPGNFGMENGVNVPVVHDGSILWSQGVVSDPPKELPLYELSFYGQFPEERIMYVFTYRYDPTAKKGYL